jgi:hypothetical protein
MFLILGEVLQMHLIRARLNVIFLREIIFTSDLFGTSVLHQ